MSGVKLTFLGTGTSQGVPIIGCRCPVCQSPDPADKRFRAAALVRWNGMTVLVDAGPDFRMQMLREGVSHLDGILLTHNHKDHTGGLDDVRSLNYIDRKKVDIYCETPVLDTLRREYGYAFEAEKYPGAPEWQVHLIEDRPFRVYSTEGDGQLEWVHDKGYFQRLPDGSLAPSDTSVLPAPPAPGGGAGIDKGRPYLDIIPIRGFHDRMPVLGFRFGDIAYLTDMSRLPEDQLSKLEGLEHLTLNTVSYKPHHSHFSLDEALDLAGRIGARHTWLTHLSHTFPCHRAFCEELRLRCRERGITGTEVLPARDGLTLEDSYVSPL